MEMTATDGWLRSAPLAETLDNYFSVHRYDGKPLSTTSITSQVDITSRYDQLGHSINYPDTDAREDAYRMNSP